MKLSSLSWRRWLLALVCAWGATSASAVTFEGQAFDDSLHLAGSDLVLNGVGLRAVLFIKGYAAALYLPEKSTQPKAILHMAGPKRLQLRMLLEVSSAEFQKAFMGSMRKNSTDAELAKLESRMARFEAAIHAAGTLKRGDTINLDFQPQVGMVMTLNGSPRGEAIEGADFYSKLLEIFLGESPADVRLKRGLLGAY